MYTTVSFPALSVAERWLAQFLAEPRYTCYDNALPALTAEELSIVHDAVAALCRRFEDAKHYREVVGQTTAFELWQDKCKLPTKKHTAAWIKQRAYLVLCRYLSGEKGTEAKVESRNQPHVYPADCFRLVRSQDKTELVWVNEYESAEEPASPVDFGLWVADYVDQLSAVEIEALRYVVEQYQPGTRRGFGQWKELGEFLSSEFGRRLTGRQAKALATRAAERVVARGSWGSHPDRARCGDGGSLPLR